MPKQRILRIVKMLHNPRQAVIKAVYAKIAGLHGSCNAVQISHHYGKEARMRFKKVSRGEAIA